MFFNGSAVEMVFADADAALLDEDVRPAAVILRGKSDQQVSSADVERWHCRQKGQPRPPVLVRLAAGSADAGTLAAYLAAGADGILLGDCRNRADLQALDVALGVAEALTGAVSGATAILAEYATTAQSLLSPHGLTGVSPRLQALVFDAARLAQALGLGGGADLHRQDAIRHARMHVVLKAREAGLSVYEVPGVAADTATLQAFAARARADGFAGLVARSTAELQRLRAAAA